MPPALAIRSTRSPSASRVRSSSTSSLSGEGEEEGDEEEGGGKITPLPSSSKGGFSLRGRPPFAPEEAPLCPCSFPSEPPAARASLTSSSRTMRRLKITPSSVRENTLFSSKSLRARLTVAGLSPTRRASISVEIGRPCTVRWPYGSPSCMTAIISIHRPRAISEQRRRPLSVRQSPG